MRDRADAITREEAGRLDRWYRGIAADYRAAAVADPLNASVYHRAAETAQTEADRYHEIASVPA